MKFKTIGAKNVFFFLFPSFKLKSTYIKSLIPPPPQQVEKKKKVSVGGGTRVWLASWDVIIYQFND